MKILIKNAEINGRVFVYVNNELMKYTSEADSRRIVNALLKMFENNIEIEVKKEAKN